MKIFIIDDEKVHVFLTRKKLVSEGLAEDKDIYTFLFAKEAVSAIVECEDEELPDVVLLDINMPEMNGWQFLEAIEPIKLKLTEKCRIYIVTSSISISDEAKANDNPLVSGFIRKPISKEDIGKICS